LHGDDEPFVARDVITADLLDDGAATAAVEHPRDEPGIDVWRQMTDDIAPGRVYPHIRVLRARWIRDEDEPIPLMEAVDDLHARTEDGAVHRGAEFASSREYGRHA